MEAQKQSYDRFNFVRSITLMLIIFQIILSRPRWCKTKGDKIDVIKKKEKFFFIFSKL